MSGHAGRVEFSASEAALTAFEVIFACPDAEGRLHTGESRVLQLLRLYLETFVQIPATGFAGTADCLNSLNGTVAKNGFAAVFAAELLEAFVRHQVLPGALKHPDEDQDCVFLLDNAVLLADFLRDSVNFVAPEQRRRMLPGSREIFAALPQTRENLISLLLENDPFSRNRAFSFRDGRFIPVVPDSVKDTERFFGFPGVRALYADHFAAFASGRSNLPLLINSLPGYGKTSMVLSYAMAHENLIPVLPEPDALESNWCLLVDKLARRQDLKFVIIFDDIDPRSVDWYSFRTHVGGAFAPPSNIMPVLVANYDFPPSILSRGRKISYPVFDELRCTEMVEDFLKSFGMRHPPANLVSLIGADYTEEFAQKKFTELSPRTLMRYLKVYETDQNKRRTMVQLSTGELITRPDAELFYEFNINLMRSLYGEEYIKNLLKERLKEL